MLLSGLLQILFNAADTIVVGRFAGHTSMAAIGATASITNLLVNLFMGISIGVNVVVARNIGMKDEDGVDRAVSESVEKGQKESAEKGQKKSNKKGKHTSHTKVLSYIFIDKDSDLSLQVQNL